MISFLSIITLRLLKKNICSYTHNTHIHIYTYTENSQRTRMFSRNEKLEMKYVFYNNPITQYKSYHMLLIRFLPVCRGSITYTIDSHTYVTARAFLLLCDPRSIRGINLRVTPSSA